MNILIVGCNGMLGTDMMIEAAAAGHAVTGVDFPGIDITDPESISRQVAHAKPDAIINCAAYTAVDACETEAAAAFAVNARGAGNLARAASACRSLFVHYSTDYVFDGKKTTPYVESDPTGPVTVYGKSKLEGERLAIEACERSLIVRIAWLYGAHGNHFVKSIRSAARKKAAAGERLNVVNDQWGTPTWTVPVCRQTLALMATQRYGLYHGTCEGACTWFAFAERIIKAAGIPARLAPCTTAEFPRPAPRPAWSVLENERLNQAGLNIMPDWREAFAGFLRAEGAVTA
ncbi:MAG: dTDP-4-dehydrorhamnose reductase [Chitinispirillaceae bacterium]|nr:dTDP-4-dehydrorhamnose reductase [Chitinispirillaceae bacterium]